MRIIRSAIAKWAGGFKDGRGAITTQSGSLNDYPYGYGSRFEGVQGTNPEELLGAAHAGCFTMALSRILEHEGLVAKSLETKAQVTLEPEGEGYRIGAVKLTLSADASGIDADKFIELAVKAKSGCPVSKALAEVSISLEVVLKPNAAA